MLDKKQIPNLLTYARIAAVPLCLLVMWLVPSNAAYPDISPDSAGPRWLLVIFILASITDFYDGALARKWDAITPIGTLLDPIADKLLVTVMLLYLISQNALYFIPSAIILLREAYISGLRRKLAKRQLTLPVSRGGKWKTMLQMLAIGVLLAHLALHDPKQDGPSQGAAPTVSHSTAPVCDVHFNSAGVLQRNCDAPVAAPAVAPPTKIEEHLETLGFLLLCAAAILAVYTALSYASEARRSLKTL